ncbi:hypothetical protein Q1695_008367 [Nippostrongylus brasiliensis]|nr:hypothetical protein Q1695_008367 [Nippostrongylus brasiliensis]
MLLESQPKSIEIGRKPRKLLVEICNIVSEFLVVVAHTFLYRFGGYSSSEFRDYSFAGKIAAKMCLDDRVIRYCQRSAHLADQAIQKHNLEKYEVSIEDRSGETLICFRVLFRRARHFYNRKLRNLIEPELDTLQSDLSEVLRSLQELGISDELQERLDSTPTRLRIRLQLCNEQPKRLFKKTIESKLPEVLLPVADTVRNDYNHLIFGVFVPEDEDDISRI